MVKRKLDDKGNALSDPTNKRSKRASVKPPSDKQQPSTKESSTKQAPVKDIRQPPTSKENEVITTSSKQPFRSLEDPKGLNNSKPFINNSNDTHRFSVTVLRYAGVESPAVVLFYDTDVLFDGEIVLKPNENEVDLRNKIFALIRTYIPSYAGDFEFVFAFWNILHLLTISEYRMSHLQKDKLYVRLTSPHPIPPRAYLRSAAGKDNIRLGVRNAMNDSFVMDHGNRSSSWQQAPDNIDPMQILNRKVDEHFSGFIGVPELNNLAKSIAVAAYFNWLEANPIKHPGHIVLQGNPGTGKTTGARALANFLWEVGIVNGSIVEAYRDDLVDCCIGGTERKTNEVIRSGYGGVVILDEVYTLNKPSSPNDFGHEALTTIMKYMTEESAPVFIFIGYKQYMTEFIRMNQGFQRRVKYMVELKDYGPSALANIVRKKLVEMQRDYDKKIPFEDYFRQLPKEYLHLRNASAAVRLAEVAQAKTRIRLLSEPHKNRLASCRIIIKQDFDDAFAEILKEGKPDRKDESYLNLFL